MNSSRALHPVAARASGQTNSVWITENIIGAAIKIHRRLGPGLLESVELKCKEQLHPVDYAQSLSHLRLLGLQVGLLINFHVVMLKDGIKRIVNNYEEESPSLTSIESQRSRRTPAEDAEQALCPKKT